MSRTDPRGHSAAPSPNAAAFEGAALLRTLAELLPASGADVARPASETAESRERLAHTAERRIWRAQDAAQWVLARDVGAYARALRGVGMTSRQVLAAVVALVREAAAPTVSDAPLDDLVHDAGRYCVGACFAR
jgi:hypothetical protein